MAAPAYDAHLDLVVNDVVYDPTRDVLYASVADTDSSHPNMVVTIDAASSEVIDEHSLGARPTQLALSDDGTSLFVGIDGAGALQKVTLPGFTESWSYSFETFVGTLQTAGDISVMPGSNDVVAVTRRVPEIGRQQTMIIDAGVARPNTGPVRFGLNAITIEFNENGLELFEATADGADDFYRHTVGPDGVSATSEVADLGGAPIAYHDGDVYVGDGKIVDVTTPTPTLRGTVAGGRGVAIDPVLGRVYYADQTDGIAPDSIVAYDLITLTIIDRWEFSSPANFGLELVSLGDERFAYRDYRSGLVLVDLSPDFGSMGEYTPLTPDRILDTRSGLGRNGVVARLGAGQTIDVQVAGVGGVPATGATTVVLNLAVVAPTQPGFLTVFPTGLQRPTISSLNFTGGNTVANLVTMPLGVDGKVSVYNPFGQLDVLFDVAGFYTSVAGPDGARFHSLTPSRAMDTRDGTGGWSGSIPGGQTARLQLGGVGSVPTGARAVALNVTVTGPTAPSFVTVYPTDVAQPTVSNVNFAAGSTLANQVIVRLPADGAVNVFNANGATHVIVDVVGYFDDVEDGERGRFIPVAPFRDVDTREESPFDPPGNLWAGDLLYYGSPDETASAYVMNVTVTATEGFGFVTAFPYADESSPIPLASTLNYSPGRTVPNHAIVATGPFVGFYNAGGRVHLIVDFFGYYT